MKKKKAKKTEVELLEEKLYQLLTTDNKDGIVISIKGSWGIGKSHFWRNFSEKHGIGKSTYISLFGKPSIDSIKRDIVYSISIRTKIISKIREKIGASNYLGIDVASLLSALEKTDFSDITICFDDFERISNNVDIKDVMGLISELKEQKSCKIILINNTDQLEEIDYLNSDKVTEVKSSKNGKKYKELKYYISRSSNKRFFDLFYEKIVDYEFLYSPSISENFNVVKNCIIYFDRSLILRFLENTSGAEDNNKNFNIRIMKKLVNTLNVFSFLSKHGVSDQIRDSISAYIFEKIYGKKIDPYDFKKINLMSLHEHIDLAIRKSLIGDEAEFVRKIKLVQQDLEEERVHAKAVDLYEKFNFDLSYKNSQFIEELFSLFKDNKSRIVKILGIDSFSFYIDVLSRIDAPNKDKYHSFFIESSKAFIDSLMVTDDGYQILVSEEFSGHFSEYKELLDYLEQKRNQYTDRIIGSNAELVELLNRPIQQRGWSPRDEMMLSSISVRAHKEHMKKSREYLFSAFKFARWVNTFSGDKPFKEAQNNIIKAIKELSEESPEMSAKLFHILDILKSNNG